MRPHAPSAASSRPRNNSGTNARSDGSRGGPRILRLGARMLVKSPGLTVIAVSALAVAIGAGAAYLEFTRDVMHPTLPLANGERIVGIQIWNPERNAAETRVLADFVAWRDAADTIEFFGAARRVDAGVLTWWDDSLRVETIAYACALALLVALLVGVVPALKATGATLQGRLREAGAAVSTMRFWRCVDGRDDHASGDHGELFSRPSRRSDGERCAHGSITTSSSNAINS